MKYPAIVLLLFLVLPAIALAQPARFTLTGNIIDQSTGTPLPGAHVFIAASKMGTATDRDGNYSLSDVPAGAHRLYVSMVGYEPQQRDIFVRHGDPLKFDFGLKPSTVELGGVEIEGKDNKRWRQQLEKFTKLFVGETPYSRQTKIVNPEVLDFKDAVTQFTAKAGETLVIENRALGYRIRYFLKEFRATGTKTSWDGEPLFEDMEPQDAEQAATWEANRKKAFYGSFRHFALALMAGKEEEHGFHVFSRPQMIPNPVGSGGPGASAMMGNQRFPIKRSEYYADGPAPDQKKLDFHGSLEIMYMGEQEEDDYRDWMRGYGQNYGKSKFQTSYIYLENGPALIDTKGDTVDPYSILFMGFWAYERVADQLPKEYRPG